MTDPTTTIAGEPLDILASGIPAIRTKRLPDGWYHVSLELEGEVFVSWQRAIERYAADFIRPGHTDPVDARYADAFVRLVLDITDALGPADGGQRTASV